jgi:hypothetical protein
MGGTHEHLDEIAREGAFLAVGEVEALVPATELVLLLHVDHVALAERQQRRILGLVVRNRPETRNKSFNFGTINI